MNRHKFTIYPNEAQRSQIDLLLKLSQIQWNHAVLTRERLLKYLKECNFEKIFDIVLSRAKNDNHPTRRSAIQDLCLENPCIHPCDAGRVFDAYQFSGDLFRDTHRSCSSVSSIITEVRRIHEYDSARVIEQLTGSINIHAGLLAIDFMKRSFTLSNHGSISQCRSNLTGFSPNSRWQKAISRGIPRHKKDFHSFSFSPYCTPDAIFREMSHKRGYLSYLTPLAKHSRLVVTDYDCSLEKGSLLREITVKKEADDVFTLIASTDSSLTCNNDLALFAV